MTITLDRRALLAAFAAAGGSAAFAHPAFARAVTEGDFPALKAFIDGYVEAKKLPGLVCAIKYKSDPVRYLSAGTLAFDTDLKCGPDSLYRIYSMTKPITGMAVMKLIEENKLGLDQPVSDVLPEFKALKVITDPKTLATAPPAKPMLIRHLLTHTAGLGYSILKGPLSDLYTKAGVIPGARIHEKQPGADLAPVATLDELVARLGELPLGSEPGTRWDYSVAFDVLGAVVQRVSKTPFSDYLHNHFFKPLKMNDTDFMVPAAKAERLASVYAVKDGKPIVAEDRKGSPFLRDRDLPSGGGGLVSTAHDYIRWTSMLLNEGVLNGVRVVKAETVRTAASNLLPEGAAFNGAFGTGGAFGAGVSIVTEKTAKPGGEPPGSYGWFGIAGTQEWTDPVNKVSVVLMLQLNPTIYPVRQEVRVAAYKDFAALKV
jgi:CubicO group peptidase (beta-lactamase class C family)